jgi:hypothetical protein
VAHSVSQCISIGLIRQEGLASSHTQVWVGPINACVHDGHSHLGIADRDLVAGQGIDAAQAIGRVLTLTDKL